MSDEEREYVQLGDGRFGTVPKSQLASVQAKGGRIAGSWEVEEARKKREGSTPMGMAKEHLEGEAAGLVGMARGASLGASDETALALADILGQKEPVRKKLNELQEAHPYKSGAGELAGTILGTEGAGAPEASAKAAPAVVRGVEHGLAHVAPHLLEEAPTVAETVAKEAPAIRHALESPAEVVKRITGQDLRGPLSPEEAARHQELIDQWVEGHLNKAKEQQAQRQLMEADPLRKAAQEEATNAGGRARPSPGEGLDPRDTPDWWRNIEGQAAPEAESDRIAREFAEGKGPRDEPTKAGLNATPIEDVPTRVDPLQPPRIRENLEPTSPGLGPRRSIDVNGADPLAMTQFGPRAAEPHVHMGEVVEPTLHATGPGTSGTRIMGPAERTVDVIGQEILKNPVAAEAAAEAALPRSPITSAMPAHILGVIGEEVEKRVGKLMGPEAKSLLGKMAQEGVKGASRGAVEGAILGATQELDEEALGDEKLNGEKLLAAMGHGALWGGVTGGALGSGGVLTRRVAGDLAAGVSRLKGEFAFRALDGITRDVKRASNIPGGARAVGEYIVENGYIKAGDKLEDIAPRLMRGVEEKGEQLGVFMDAHDRAGLRGPAVTNILKDMRGDVLGRLRELPSLNQGAISRIEALQRDLMNASKITDDGQFMLTFRDAQRLRARIDDAVRWTRPAPGAPVSELNEALKGARRSMERELEGAIDRSGSGLGKEYRAVKDEYRKLRVASDTANDALERKAARNIVRPTDYLASALGAMSGHPLLGIAGGIAHHIVKDRGNATAAVALEKLGGIGVVRAARDRVDRQVARGVARVFGEGSIPVKLKDPIYAGNHEQRVEALARAIMTGGHTEQVFQAVAPISSTAPKTSAAFTAAALRVTKYLASVMPQQTPRPFSLTPQLEPNDWSDAEKAKFNRAVDVAHEPMIVLSELESGTITSDQVDAMKQMYPGLYADMANELAMQLAQRKEPLRREQRLALGVFLDRPVDPGMEAQFIATMQQNFPTSYGLPPPGAPKPKKGGHAKAPKQGTFDHMIESMALEGSLDRADDEL